MEDEGPLESSTVNQGKWGAASLIHGSGQQVSGGGTIEI